MKKGIRAICTVMIFSILIIQQYKIEAMPTFKEQQIKKVVKSYFHKRYEILSSLTWDDKIENFFVPDDSKGLHEKDVLQTIIEYRTLQKTNLKFKNYNYRLDYESINIDKDIVIVNLYESHSMYFDCSPEIKSEMSGARHKLVLVKTSDGWRIKEHSYYDEIRNKLENYYIEYGSLDKAKEEILKEAQMQREMYRDVNSLALNYKISQEQEKMNMNKKEAGGLHFAGYNINGAVEYALTYALIMNPKYGNYEKWGGDCTNFISQCLHAGKIPFDSEGKDVRYHWYWYSESKRTPSWTAAESLKFYIGNNNKDSISIGLKAHAIKLNDILRGDIIQLVDEKGHAYHSMICTGYAVKNGWVVDYLISQHSGYDEDHSRRLKNYPLSQKGGVGIFWSIDEYYYK